MVIISKTIVWTDMLTYLNALQTISLDPVFWCFLMEGSDALHNFDSALKLYFKVFIPLVTQIRLFNKVFTSVVPLVILEII